MSSFYYKINTTELQALDKIYLLLTLFYPKTKQLGKQGNFKYNKDKATIPAEVDKTEVNKNHFFV